MRVDLTNSGLQQAENSKAGRAGQPGAAANQSRASAGASAAADSGVDRAQFSFDGTRVRALAVQALAAPEIRQAKVASLAQAIGKDAYTVDSGKVAEAITAEFSGATFR